MTEANTNLHEYSVSEIATTLKRTVEERFGLVRVRGEISGLKVAASGHAYLTLKDDQAVLDGVMWKGSVQALRFRPADGLEVVCTGRLTTYAGRSKYQMVIDYMEPAGVGALMALLEQRKKALAAEGLFDEGRKKPLPFLPTHIGVITSPTGAVIRDILHRLADRFPCAVTLWPVLVQGESAAPAIAAAIRGFNAMVHNRPDVLIVARGGGSVEDLWAFNEEAVVRAAAQSAIPLISAVGHETDVTLIDFAADRRAPTPTAAAEMAVPVRAALQEHINTLSVRLPRAVQRSLQESRERLRAATLPPPRRLLEWPQQRLDDATARLPRALRAGVWMWQGRLDRLSGRLSIHGVQRRVTEAQAQTLRVHAQLGRAWWRSHAASQQRLAHAGRLVETLSPLNTLKRGYVVVRDSAGHVVTSASVAGQASSLSLQFHDGVAVALPSGGAPARRAKPSPMDQDTLF